MIGNSDLQNSDMKSFLNLMTHLKCDILDNHWLLLNLYEGWDSSLDVQWRVIIYRHKQQKFAKQIVLYTY